MRIGIGAARGAALVVSSLLVACGTGGQRVDPIYQGVVGPAGGTVENTTVRLVLPPGALTTDVAIRILPQPDPLPLDPQAGAVEELPGLMCIGPVGHDLALPSHVRFCYDPSVLPEGADESDMVLLVWDDVAGVLRVSQTAVQDLATHCFDDVVYLELGHIGVGVRTGPDYDFVVQATDPDQVVPAGPVVPLLESLVLASSEGGAAPLPIPNTQYASLYVPSPDGRRVLCRISDPMNDGQFLRAVDASNGDVLYETPPDLFVNGGDPLFGWFPVPTQLFFAHSEFDGKTSRDVFADVTIGGAAHLHLRDGPSDAFLRDVRGSPDGARVLLRWTHFFFGFDSVDVIASSTGAIVGSDLPVLPAGPFSVTPRWLPDSSGLYWADPTVDGVVRRIDADGSDPGVLYTVSGGSVLDFVLAPGATLGSPGTARCAYVRANFVQDSGQVVSEGLVPQTTFFGVDVLAGGARTEQDLGGVYEVAETAYHPDGGRVLVQLSTGGRIGGGPVGAVTPPPSGGSFVVVFDAADAGTLRTIAAPMGALDVSRADGRILVWMSSDTQDAQFPAVGIWRLDPDASGGTLVDMPGWAPMGPPRFLASWRTACTEGYSAYVR